MSVKRKVIGKHWLFLLIISISLATVRSTKQGRSPPNYDGQNTEKGHDSEYGARARTLAAKFSFFAKCTISREFGTEPEPRLAAVFRGLDSTAAGSTELNKVQDYGILLDLILANTNSSNGHCNGDYIDLAYKVLDLERNSAALNTSSSEVARKLHQLKGRFNPEVFKLFQPAEKCPSVIFSKDHPSHALFALEAPISGYTRADLNYFAMRPYDSRVPGFRMNLLSAKGSDGENSFNITSAWDTSIILRLPESFGPLRLVPTLESMGSNSSFFQFRLMQTYAYQRGWIFYRLTESTSELPAHVQRNGFALDEIWNILEEGSIFEIRHLKDDSGCLPEERISYPLGRPNVTEEVRDLYPPCRNETDLLDRYRLSDFLQVFSSDAERNPLRLRAAFDALLDEILASPFLCGQDYVQLAYHVQLHGRDINATGGDLENQAWRNLRARFNPRVFELFDDQKYWALLSEDEPGYTMDFNAGKRKGLKRWDKRLLSFATRYQIVDKGRGFEAFTFVEDTVRQEIENSHRTKSTFFFLPTPESVAEPAANKTFQFWLATAGRFQTSFFTYYWLYWGQENNKTEECRPNEDSRLNCTAMFHFEDMSDVKGSPNVTTVEEARSWYPPCEDHWNIFEEWRLMKFFEAFNSELISSSALVRAYDAMFDAILSTSPIVCTQDLVQLASKVHQIQHRLNGSDPEAEDWARLRNRFNPSVFDLFDSSKSWRIKSVKHPDHALLGDDRQTESNLNEFDVRSRIELRKIDSRFPAFKWRFQMPPNGRAFELTGYTGLPFQRYAGNTFKQQIVPTLESLAPNSTVFHFSIVHLNFNLVHTFRPTTVPSGFDSWYKPPPEPRPGFLQRLSNESFDMTFWRRFNDSELFFLEPATDTAPSADISVADQVKELFPPCETRQDAFTLDRLWDVFQVFSSDIANASILLEAYDATLDAILAPSAFNCTGDYLQLASQIHELEKKLNRTKLDGDQFKQLQRLKNRFNPGVFKLLASTGFEATEAHIMSVEKPGFVLVGHRLELEESSPLNRNGYSLRSSASANITTSELYENPNRWTFWPLPRASSFMAWGIYTEYANEIWNQVIIVPTVSSTDSMATNFQFELHYVEKAYGDKRKVWTIPASNARGSQSQMGDKEEELIVLESIAAGSVKAGDAAKFYLEHV